jgi:hypothetical protein
MEGLGEDGRGLENDPDPFARMLDQRPSPVSSCSAAPSPRPRLSPATTANNTLRGVICAPIRRPCWSLSACPHDGRLTVRQNPQLTGWDELLRALYQVHKQPRYDLYWDMLSLSKSGCSAIS